MNLHQILFPTDLSSHHSAALSFASLLAAEAKATLHILHVDDLRNVRNQRTEVGHSALPAWDRNERVTIREELVEIGPTVPHVAHEHHYRRGTPAAEILKFAQAKSVDLIVMSSHGRTGLARLVMGSVAEEVMRKAPCPVLVVKQPAARGEFVDALNAAPARA